LTKEKGSNRRLGKFATRSFTTYIQFTKYCKGDNIKENGMGRSYSTHERDEKCSQKFRPENLEGRDHLEMGRIILHCMLKK
jgi:hypothetical protein